MPNALIDFERRPLGASGDSKLREGHPGLPREFSIAGIMNRWLCLLYVGHHLSVSRQDRLRALRGLAPLQHSRDGHWGGMAAIVVGVIGLALDLQVGLALGVQEYLLL